MKKMMDYMEEANAVVPRISGADAVAHISDEGAVFIDVRDQYMIAESGTIDGAHHIRAGFLNLSPMKTARCSTRFSTNPKPFIWSAGPAAWRHWPARP